MFLLFVFVHLNLKIFTNVNNLVNKIIKIILESSLYSSSLFGTKKQKAINGTSKTGKIIKIAPLITEQCAFLFF